MIKMSTLKIVSPNPPWWLIKEARILGMSWSEQECQIKEDHPDLKMAIGHASKPASCVGLARVPLPILARD